MQLEIEQKRKLPQNVKENIKTNIFHTLIAAVIVVAYLVAINLMYYKLDHNNFEHYMKYFALVIIITTVIDIEIAYRKDSRKLALRRSGYEYLKERQGRRHRQGGKAPRGGPREAPHYGYGHYQGRNNLRP